MAQQPPSPAPASPPAPRAKTLWCIIHAELFAPAIEVGWASDRVIYVETGDDKTVLQCTVGDIFIPDLHLDTIQGEDARFQVSGVR